MTGTEKHIAKFLPAVWVDEAIPSPQRDVNDFIHRLADGSWILMPKDEEEQDEDFWRQPLEPGQTIAFLTHEFYGWFTIHVAEDRSIDDGGIPDKANCYCLDGDVDTLVDTLAELVENGDGAPLEPGSHDITAYWWSDAETHFRFIIDENGQGRFEPCAGAN